MYAITEYTKQRAAELGVLVRPSKNATKKLDVYKSGAFITSIGDVNYSDYPTYMKSHGKKYADERRRAFYARHAKSIRVHGSPAWYAAKLLW